ncbi:MAG: type fimbrial biosis protein FimT [Pseudomonadota bacterium]
MVTVTILAIGAAIAAPSYSAMIKRNRSRSVASELLAALNLARSEAARRGQPVTVCKSSDGSSCAGSSIQWDSGWIVFVNENAQTEGSPAVRDSGELILLARQNLPGGVTVRPNNNLANYLTYSRTGLANQMGTFAVCSDSDETRAQAIVVDLTRALLTSDSNGNGIPEKADTNGNLVDIGSCENP